MEGLIVYIVSACHWEEHGTPMAFEDLETAKAQPGADHIWVVELNNPKGPYEWYWSPERTHEYVQGKLEPIPRERWKWTETKYDL